MLRCLKIINRNEEKKILSAINYLIFCLSILIAPGVLSSQKMSGAHIDDIDISVITCGPGEDLYSLFGHSAVRVQDRSGNLDVVYNWGTFDYGAPTIFGKLKFALNFLSGRLKYKLSLEQFHHFLRVYQYYERSVDEQHLDLTTEEKRHVLEAIRINMLDENRYYKYDFYFDNCTTRIRDILEGQYPSISYPDSNNEDKTFRNLLHENLGDHPWTKFGMDIVLGTQSDQVTSKRDQMFLPAYFQLYLDGASSQEKNLVNSTNNLLHFDASSKTSSRWTPMRLFGILLLIEIIGFFLFYISGDLGFLKWFDDLWYAGLCIASAAFLLLWLATDHTVCRNNWNLLWALPTSLLYFGASSKIRRIGFLSTLLGSVILLLSWTIIPQEMSNVLIPIVTITILKSARRLGIAKLMDRFRKKPSIAVILMLFAATLLGQEKIGGITLVSPPEAYSSDPMLELTTVNANWVALVPYGFSRPGNPEVRHGSSRQWWGEREEGIETSLKLAKANDLKVMLKPQVWIPGGWVGEEDFNTEEEWKIWEDSYRAYIMTFVALAKKYEVDMFCVGTEYRISIVKREAFWRSLITEIKSMYSGALTYSSNWDSYDKVPIWDALDYIGISAYFPLSDIETPPSLLLSYRWNKYVKKLKKFSKRYNKKIIFTEYGYLSVDGAAGKTWELEKHVISLDINEQAQANGYEALLGAFWNQEFWAGGFLWKWFPGGRGHEGYPERDYTPQNKKAEAVLQKWYGKKDKI